MQLRHHGVAKTASFAVRKCTRTPPRSMALPAKSSDELKKLLVVAFDRAYILDVLSADADQLLRNHSHITAEALMNAANLAEDAAKPLLRTRIAQAAARLSVTDRFYLAIVNTFGVILSPTTYRLIRRCCDLFKKGLDFIPAVKPTFLQHANADTWTQFLDAIELLALRRKAVS